MTSPRDFQAIAAAYIAGVLDGSEIVCRKVRQTIERHLRDLEDGPNRGLYYDAEAGARFCRFFESIQPSKWPEPMVLQPWQVTHYMILYGWKRADGSRRFRVSFDMWPRKTGKSAANSVQGLYALEADNELGPEVYAVALTVDQARRVFDESVAMRDGTPHLKKSIVKEGGALVKSLRTPGTHGIYKPLSRDKDTMEGLNVSFASGDEVHKWKNRVVYEVIRYGMRSRFQPLFSLITTAPDADDTTSICNYFYTYSEKILEGVFTDDAFFCWITELDGELKDDDDNVIQEADRWDDESKWKKANPNLGVTVKIEDMRQECLEAKNDPANLNAFQRYSLNIRVGAAEAAIQIKKWDACGRDGVATDLRRLAFDRLKGQLCFAGLDLALVDDTSSLCLMFPPMNGRTKWECISFFWIPAENIRARVEKDQVPYDLWRDQGFLVATPGEVTDHDFIADRIAELSGMFDVRELIYDPALASGLIKTVLTNGFKKDRVVKFAQTYLNYAAPCGDFSRLIRKKELLHDKDPVLRWQASNLRWAKNHTGLIMPDKLKSVEKIDGMVAAIMAYGRANHPDNAKLIRPGRITSI